MRDPTTTTAASSAKRERGAAKRTCERFLPPPHPPTHRRTAAALAPREERELGHLRGMQRQGALAVRSLRIPRAGTVGHPSPRGPLWGMQAK